MTHKPQVIQIPWFDMRCDGRDLMLMMCNWHTQDDAPPFEVRGLWHPLLLLSAGEAEGIAVQPNDLALGG